MENRLPELDKYIQTARQELEQGRGPEALARFVDLRPQFGQYSQYWLVLGNLYQALGQAESARQAYQQALSVATLPPEQAALILSNLGWLQQQSLQLAEAEASYRQALRLQPQLVFTWNNLSTLKLEQGELKAAEAALQRCLQLAPTYAPAWVNRGLLALQHGEHTQARQAFQQARHLDPHLPASWREDICLLLESRQIEAAQNLLQTALNALPPSPQSAELFWLQARLDWLQHKSASSATLQTLKWALTLAPERLFWRWQAELGDAESHFLAPPEQQQAYLDQLYTNLQHWNQSPLELTAQLRELRYLPEMLWHLSYLGDSPHLELRQAQAQCLRGPSLPKDTDSTHSGPLRLGVLVTPGHEGIFNKLGAPLLAQVDPTEVEIWLLGDPERLTSWPTAKVHTLSPSLLNAARQIQALDLELLYYWEIGSDVLNFYLPWFRPAPIQFTGWGTPLTTGLPDVDFYLSDQLTEPEGAQQHYSEELLLLPQLPLYLHPIPKSSEQELQVLRSELQLPPHAPVYACLQNPLKFSRAFLRTLSQILSQAPDANLLLLQSRQTWVQQQVEAVLNELLATAPAALRQRLLWLPAPLPRERYLQVLQLADLVLDSWDYSGGQSHDEALALGRPVLTLPGRSARSRLTLGRLRQLGSDEASALAELIATSPQDYLARALNLIRLPKREQIQQTLAAQLPRLLQNPESPRQWTAALWEMARRRGLRSKSTSE